jgi:competence protein ComEC
MSFTWDGASGTVLWPDIPPDEIGPSAKNNDSLVLRMQYGATSLLLPGDAEKEVERAIVEQNAAEQLRADVLKVGHHGSKNSTTSRFLEVVSPRVAIISAGEDNAYGQPSSELLERLRSIGAWILRTDRNGAIHVLADGKTLEITCFVTCSEKSDPATSVRAEAPNQQRRDKNE